MLAQGGGRGTCGVLCAPVTPLQVTIRTADITKTLAFWKALGFVVLSHQPVTQYGFSLYFLAGASDAELFGAVPDVGAVEVRERLWAAPFCTLEIQYFSDGRAIRSFAGPAQAQAGFMGLVLGCADPRQLRELVQAALGPTSVDADGALQEPNGIPLTLEAES